MKLKLFFSFLLFFILTVGTYLWLHQSMSFHFDTFKTIDKKMFIIGGALSVVLFVSDAFRYKVLIESLNEKISFLHALEASIINFFFAWTTPGAILAAPMTSYFLVKRKCTLGVSLLSSFGKSIIGLIHLLSFTILLSYLSGIHNFFEKKFYLPIYIGLVNYLIFSSLLVIFALYSWRIDFLPKKIRGIIEKLRELFKNITKRDMIKIFFSQTVFFFCLILFTSLLIHPFLTNASWAYSWALSSIFLSLVYLSPTPGGIGLGELVGIPILGKFMPSTDAVTATLLVRLFIVYMPILVGAFYLLGYFAKRFRSPDKSS